MEHVMAGHGGSAVNEIAAFLTMNSRSTTTAARMYDIASLLVRAGIDNVDALLPLKYDDLFSIKGIGPIKARVIQSAVWESGRGVDREYLRFRYSEIDLQITDLHGQILMRRRNIEQLELQQSKILEVLDSIQTEMDQAIPPVVLVKQLTSAQIAERNRSNQVAAAVQVISDFMDDHCRSIYTTRIAKSLVKAGVLDLGTLKGMDFDHLLGVDGMYKQQARIVQRAIYHSGVRMDESFLDWERNRLITENAELAQVVKRANDQIGANNEALQRVRAAMEEER